MNQTDIVRNYECGCCGGQLAYNENAEDFSKGPAFKCANCGQTYADSEIETFARKRMIPLQVRTMPTLVSVWAPTLKRRLQLVDRAKSLLKEWLELGREYPLEGDRDNYTGIRHYNLAENEAVTIEATIFYPSAETRHPDILRIEIRTDTKNTRKIAKHEYKFETIWYNFGFPEERDLERTAEQLADMCDIEPIPADEVLIYRDLVYHSGYSEILRIWKETKNSIFVREHGSSKLYRLSKAALLQGSEFRDTASFAILKDELDPSS